MNTKEIGDAFEQDIQDELQAAGLKAERNPAWKQRRGIADLEVSGLQIECKKAKPSISIVYGALKQHEGHPVVAITSGDYGAADALVSFRLHDLPVVLHAWRDAAPPQQPLRRPQRRLADSETRSPWPPSGTTLEGLTEWLSEHSELRSEFEEMLKIRFEFKQFTLYELSEWLRTDPDGIPEGVYEWVQQLEEEDDRQRAAEQYRREEGCLI